MDSFDQTFFNDYIDPQDPMATIDSQDTLATIDPQATLATIDPQATLATIDPQATLAANELDFFTNVDVSTDMSVAALDQGMFMQHKEAQDMVKWPSQNWTDPFLTDAPEVSQMEAIYQTRWVI
jgi:hypothetical protein